jgi:hypothetical protein
MSVTYEEARILEQRHGIPSHRTLSTAHTLREHGRCRGVTSFPPFPPPAFPGPVVMPRWPALDLRCRARTPRRPRHAWIRTPRTCGRTHNPTTITTTTRTYNSHSRICYLENRPSRSRNSCASVLLP